MGRTGRDGRDTNFGSGQGRREGKGRERSRTVTDTVLGGTEDAIRGTWGFVRRLVLSWDSRVLGEMRIPVVRRSVNNPCRPWAMWLQACDHASECILGFSRGEGDRFYR